LLELIIVDEFKAIKRENFNATNALSEVNDTLFGVGGALNVSTTLLRSTPVPNPTAGGPRHK
jgi:hypothetical protein